MKRSAVAAFGILLATLPASAQDWPTKPVRFVIPFPPGGIIDWQGRELADYLGKRTGKPSGTARGTPAGTAADVRRANMRCSSPIAASERIHST